MLLQRSYMLLLVASVSLLQATPLEALPKKMLHVAANAIDDGAHDAAGLVLVVLRLTW